MSTCPRCARALPPSADSCVHCGALVKALPAAPRPTTPGRRGSPPGGVGASGLAAGTWHDTAQWPPPAPPHKSSHDPVIGTTVAGRFLIEELVGQGGMGKVYKARHLALEKAVCLKMLKPALLEDPTLVGRFEREAKAASRLNHPNSIAILDFGRLEERGGTLYIAMEYVKGKDLRLVLRDEWPLPEARLCNIMAQVLGALGEAHAQNVIHRDLKPENIMVEQRRSQPDFVKVLDFGIAKILDSDLPGLTRSDVVCGTPQYMAPEQATGSALDARCDLYAVGVILYQMVTGHLPFDGQNSMEVLTKHVNEPPILPSQRQPGLVVSAGMEALILRAMSKDPAQRPQNAAQFRDELLDLVQPRLVSHPQVTPAPLLAATPRAHSIPSGERHTPVRVKPARPAHWGMWLAGGLAAVLVLSFAIGWSRAQKAPPPPDVPTVQLGFSAGPAKQPVQRDPDKARALISKASEWQRDGDTGAARDLLEQAVQLDPDNAEAHYRLGNLFLNSQPQRARLEYESSVRLDPTRYSEVVKGILKDM